VNDFAVAFILIALFSGLLLGGLWVAERVSEFLIGRMRL
jgi:hypothetical protein